MLVIYSVTGCESCRRIKHKLKESKKEYQELNLFRCLLDENDLDELCKYIYEDRKNLVEGYQDDIDFKNYLRNHPSSIHRPIIVSIDEDEEYVNHLKQISQNACQSNCRLFDICSHASQEIV